MHALTTTLALPMFVLGACLGAAACSSEPTGPGACVETTSTGIDKKAVAALNDESGTAQSSYGFDASATPKRSFVFVVTNTANLVSAAPLTIESVELTETDAAGATVSKPLFRCEGPTGKPCAAADFPAIIPSGFKDEACTPKGAKTGASFTVKYSHESGAGARKAQLVLNVKGDPDRKQIIVNFSTALGKPRFTCDSKVVDFGTVKAGGKPLTEVVLCRSVGSAPVVIKRAELFSTSAPPLTLSFAKQKLAPGEAYKGTPIITVAPQTSFKLTATLGSLPIEEKIAATLKITTNDFTAPVATVQFKANSTGPCLKPAPTAVDLGEVAVGVPTPQEVQLQGCGTEPVTVTKISLEPGSSGDLALDFSTGSFTAGKGPTTEDPLVVQPNATETFRVVCTPSALTAKIAGAVRITSSNTDDRVLQIACKPAKLACPKACFKVTPATTIVPQTELTLDSACSVAAAGQVIDKRKWSVTQPAGSFAKFTPSTTGKVVKFKPNVAGDYAFKLNVFDDLGKPACAPMVQQVKVVPDNKLHIELTWETKGDPVVGDKKGADLDLHLAHPLASGVKGQKDLDGNGEPDPWLARCFDCFWANPNPPWGDPFDLADNPSVDLDDYDGEGPENLSIKTPETNIFYTISAYAWTDAGYGKSTPRIRVFIDKELVFDKKGPLMGNGDMWCVAQVAYDPKATTTTAKANLIKPCKGADANGNLLTHKYPQVMPGTNLKCP